MFDSKIPRYLRHLRHQSGPVSTRERLAGDEARDRRDWPAAALSYGRHLKRHPRDAAIWVQAGHAFREQGLWDEADNAYRQAGRDRQADPDLWLHRGHLARLRGDVEGAERCYFSSFSLDGNAAARAEILSLVQGASTRVGAVDAFNNGLLTGWAIDPDFPEDPVEVEIVSGSRVLATVKAMHYRADIVHAGLGSGPSGFVVDLDKSVRTGDTIHARTKRRGDVLPPGPQTITHVSSVEAWLSRHEDLTGESLEIIRGDCTREANGRGLSIVASLRDLDGPNLRNFLADLDRQWCSEWEALFVSDEETTSSNLAILDEAAVRDKRIRLVHVDVLSTSLAGVLVAAKVAGCDAILLLNSRNIRLEPEATHRFIEALRSGCDLAYSDFATLCPSGDTVEDFRFRPAYSPDYFLSYPYFLGPVCVDRNLLNRLPPLCETLSNEAAMLDLVLHILEVAEAVGHIPALLYRSTPVTRTPADHIDMARFLQLHLERIGSDGRVGLDDTGHGFKIVYPAVAKSVLVIIPTKNRTDLLKVCLESMWRTCEGAQLDILVVDHESDDPASVAYLAGISDRVRVMPYSGAFNFARMNNVAFRRYAKDHDMVLFMNNDIEAIDDGWITRMSSLAARKDIGAVGVNLLYADQTVQHSGVIVGLHGAGDHAHRHELFVGSSGDRNAGRDHSLAATREYSAVTAACLMTRCEVFEAVGGFDEELAVGFNDTDLCLRIGSAGHRIINDGQTALYHHESATRTGSGNLDHPRDTALFVSRWRKVLADGDPSYNPLQSTRVSYRAADLRYAQFPTRIRKTARKFSPLSDARPHPAPHATAIDR